MFEMPPSLEPEAYAAWIRESPTGIRARRVEEALSTLTLVVPGMIGQAGEIVSEALTALSGLLSMHHAVLLRGDPTLAQARSDEAAAAEGGAPLPLSPSAERLARWGLSVLGSVDVVVELSALRSGGPGARWGVVSAIEAVRAAAKLALLWQSSARRRHGHEAAPRHLLHGGKVDFEAGATAAASAAAAAAGTPAAPVDASHDTSLAKAWAVAARASAVAGPGSAALAAAAAASATPASAAGTGPAEPRRFFEGARSGVRLTVPSGVSASEGEARGAGTDLDAASSDARLAAEVLHVIRPLVYAGGRALMPGEGASAPWAPWAASAALDTASSALVWAAERQACGVSRPRPRSRAEGLLSAMADTVASLGQGPTSPEGEAGEEMLSLPRRGVWDALTRAVGAARTAAAAAAAPDAAAAGPAAAGLEDPARRRGLAWPSAFLRELALWFVTGAGSRASTLSAGEADEMRRRQWALLLYLVRDPMWSLFTKPALERALGPLERVPLLGMLVGYVRSMAEYYQSIHCHTSGEA